MSFAHDAISSCFEFTRTKTRTPRAIWQGFSCESRVWQTSGKFAHSSRCDFAHQTEKYSGHFGRSKASHKNQHDRQQKISSVHGAADFGRFKKFRQVFQTSRSKLWNFWKTIKGRPKWRNDRISKLYTIRGDEITDPSQLFNECDVFVAVPTGGRISGQEISSIIEGTRLFVSSYHFSIFVWSAGKWYKALLHRRADWCNHALDAWFFTPCLHEFFLRHKNRALPWITIPA